MAKNVKLQEVAVSKLKPYENNAKTHPAEQLKRIQASIEEFGFLTPCLIDADYNIIAGHGRVEAAKQMGLKKIPCVFIEGLTENQRRAYIIADNKLSESAWDWDVLESELFFLEEQGFNIELTGFDVITPDGFDDDFELPDGEKPEFVTMTFSLHEMQKQLIEEVLSGVEVQEETFGNTNRNGNALYQVVKRWVESKK